MSGPIRDFLLSASGDLAVVNGDFAFVGGADAARQGASIRMKMFLGECILDTTLGVDWLGAILIKNADPIVVRELLREAILDTPDVNAAVGAQLQRLPNRGGTIDFVLSTVYSQNPIFGQTALGGL